MFPADEARGFICKSRVKSQKEEDKVLIDDEKVVMDILKDNSPTDLNDLKGQTGLSNKK